MTLEWSRACRWVAEEDHIVNFPTVRLKGGMPIRVTSKD
jgi:steroid 3-oxidase